MARTRSIKPAFFHDVDLMELSPLARLLFIGLWCYADKEGRLEDKPRQIKQNILPGDNCNIEELLEMLASSADPFIVRYRASGKSFIQIVNFSKHQHPHHQEGDSVLPGPDEAEEITQYPQATTKDFRRTSEVVPKSSEEIATNPSGSCYCNGSLVTGTSNAAPFGAGVFALESPPQAPIGPRAASVTTTSGAETAAVVTRRGMTVTEVDPFETWFEREFWPVYPRKDAKASAKKIARKKGATPSARDAIMAGLRAHLPSMLAKEIQYRPHGATFLGQERYLDPVDPSDRATTEPHKRWSPPAAMII